MYWVLVIPTCGALAFVGFALGRWFLRGVRLHGFGGALWFLLEVTGDLELHRAKAVLRVAMQAVVATGVGWRRSGRLTVTPPGLRLDGAARWVYSPRTYSNVLQPVLADLQAQYFEALREGRPHKAKWVCIRGYGRFWCHVLAQGPFSLLAVVKMWYSAR